MNHWHVEVMAEIHRRSLEQEIRDIRLEREAREAGAQPPAWFSLAMFNLATWMIATGKQLRRRYEAPVVCCDRGATRSFAR